MARIAPGTLSVVETKDGEIYRVTIPQTIVKDEGFALDRKRQLYIRIVKDGVLLTHKSDGDE
jgi:hypothetical protein